MAKYGSEDQESRRGSDDDLQVEEGGEEEALSLSDLPLDLIDEGASTLLELEEAGKEAATLTTQVKENEEAFNFDSWGGSLSAESEMCAADEVFFKGQILPLRRRLSVSSDCGLQDDSGRNISRCISRSESMDRCSTMAAGLTSSTNRSRFITTNPRQKIRNQFHSFPSPKPQLTVSNSNLRSLSNVGSSGRSQKSTSMWDLLRLGIVRAPEIELQDLKVRYNNSSGNRTSVSRNGSSGSGSSNSSSSLKNNQRADSNISTQQQQKKQTFLDQRKKGLFGGCKCSVTSVETVPLNKIVAMKSRSNICNNVAIEESKGTVQAMERKLHELGRKKRMKEKQQGKQEMSRHRTFEWIKELAHAK